MVMVVDNSDANSPGAINPPPGGPVDPLGYITQIVPTDRTFANVQPGDRNVYYVTFFVPLGQLVVDNYPITMRVLGFGDCVVTITNSTQCRGCQGNGNWREDLCGFCNPLPAQANLCVDCNGLPGGQAVIDFCGVCGGDNSLCTDCAGGFEKTTRGIDACGLCLYFTDARFNKTCQGCDGVLVPVSQGPPAQYDLCGVCQGANACVACNDVVYGSAEIDGCGVCVTESSEFNQSCAVIEPAVSTGAIAGIVAGIAAFIALAVIAAIVIFARVTKNFIDERKFMNAFAAGNSVGTNPLHKEKAGWQTNAISG